MKAGPTRQAGRGRPKQLEFGLLSLLFYMSHYTVLCSVSPLNAAIESQKLGECGMRNDRGGGGGGGPTRETLQDCLHLRSGCKREPESHDSVSDTHVTDGLGQPYSPGQAQGSPCRKAPSSVAL